MLQLQGLVQQPDKLGTAAACDELIVQDPLNMLESSNLPLGLTLIGGVDFDGNISVAPNQRVRMIFVAVEQPVEEVFTSGRGRAKTSRMCRSQAL